MLRRNLAALCAFMILSWRGPILAYRQGACSFAIMVPQKRAASSTSTCSTSMTGVEESSLTADERKRKAREKRKQFSGLPKAVDRGQFQVTYQPGGATGQTFQALSGLPKQRLFTVLGIESSCDDTGAAVLSSNGTILGEALASQREIHEPWGGVVPGLAKRAHEAVIDDVVREALQKAGLQSAADVDAVGVTVGPGLEICLRVGCNKAKELAEEFGKPFVGVHHLEAHILMARLPTSDMNDIPSESSKRAIDFPFLALLVSGGHCQLMKCVGIGNYTILGGTLDDALGEAFDKTARLLGLPVGGGGGPAVEALAREGDSAAIPLPVPLRQRKDLDFSYAGLKTAVRKAAERIRDEYRLSSTADIPKSDKANIAASFQYAAIKHLEQRLKYVMTDEKLGVHDQGIRTLAVVGGVAANTELRTRLQSLCTKHDWTMVVPPPRLCTDQGAMSAWAAIERLEMGSSDDPKHQEVYARYPFATKP